MFTSLSQSFGSERTKISPYVVFFSDTVLTGPVMSMLRSVSDFNIATGCILAVSELKRLEAVAGGNITLSLKSTSNGEKELKFEKGSYKKWDFQNII